jgi:hypothetical protein
LCYSEYTEKLIRGRDDYMAQNIVDVEIPAVLVPYLNTIKDGKTMEDKVIIYIVAGLFAA